MSNDKLVEAARGLAETYDHLTVEEMGFLSPKIDDALIKLIDALPVKIPPCKHCGGEHEIHKSGFLHRVLCSTCGIKTGWEMSRSEAVAKWNGEAHAKSVK